MSVAKLIGQKLERFVSKKNDQQFSMNPGEHNQKKVCCVCAVCDGGVVCVGMWLLYIFETKEEKFATC